MDININVASVRQMIEQQDPDFKSGVANMNRLTMCQYLESNGYRHEEADVMNAIVIADSLLRQETDHD